MNSADFPRSIPIKRTDYFDYRDLPGSRIGLFLTFLTGFSNDFLLSCTHCEIENTVDCRNNQ